MFQFIKKFVERERISKKNEISVKPNFSKHGRLNEEVKKIIRTSSTSLC